MKRVFENVPTEQDNESSPKHKVALVENNPQPGGSALVNPNRVAKKSHVDLMELEEGAARAELFLQANVRNKLDVIGRQVHSLQELMKDVISEAKLNYELNKVACNFVKKPGHVYHLYERPSGQKYFSMLSPEEWINAPHNFLGSYRMEADMSWTVVGEEESRYAGINYLKEMFNNFPEMKALVDSDG